jgi:transcriptional regulator with XRE-family HTH domain
MIPLGDTARYVREAHGFTQKEAAKALSVSVVHLCNIENNKSKPSPALLDRFRQVWQVDLYVLAWCLAGDVEKLPKNVRKPAKALAAAWKERLSELLPAGRDA